MNTVINKRLKNIWKYQIEVRAEEYNNWIKYALEGFKSRLDEEEIISEHDDRIMEIRAGKIKEN